MQSLGKPDLNPSSDATDIADLAHPRSGLGTGALAGIVVVSVVAAGALAALAALLLLWRAHARRRDAEKSTAIQHAGSDVSVSGLHYWDARGSVCPVPQRGV
jgi:hypothetical protein